MEKRVRIAFFFVYVLVGLYFLNSVLNFVEISPNFLERIDKWVSLIGGFLLIIGGFSFLKARRRKE